MKKLTVALACAWCFSLATAQTSEPPAPAGAATGEVPAPSPDAASITPPGSHWRVIMSPYTLHYSSSPDHRKVYMIGAEKQRDDGVVFGASYFSNSFGQPSAYLYGGKRFDNLTAYEPLFVQVTGGLLYGYKEPFEDKVPFNHNGFSPGAVLSLGWQFTPMYSAQLNFLGNSALMFQLSADFR